MSWVRKKPSNMTICAGDLNQRIFIYDRDIRAPNFGGVDYDEDFSKKRSVWAMIETVDGQEFFDGTNLISTKTHKFYIRWIRDLSIQNVVDFKNQRYKIQKIENQNEKNEFFILHCVILGSKDIQTNKA